MQIDAVITWVDSSDEVWRLKINQYLDEKIDWNDKKDSTRYNSINEIEITILSIIKFATYIKNIYVVTDNQEPKNFKKLKNKALESKINLQLIDHKVIFKGYEEYLPTFNSRSIVNMVHRIPNLSNNFVVFNDDTFLINESKKEDFFVDNKPVIIGSWDSLYEDKIIRNFYLKIKGNKKKRAGYKEAQQMGAKLLGFKKYLRRDHTPLPMKKEKINIYFKDRDEILRGNIKYRFRNSNQFLISSIYNHLEILENNYILKKNFNLLYIQSYSFFKTKLKLNSINTVNKKKFMCLQSLETAPEKTLKYILTWLDKKLDSNFANEL